MRLASQASGQIPDSDKTINTTPTASAAEEGAPSDTVRPTPRLGHSFTLRSLRSILEHEPTTATDLGDISAGTVVTPASREPPSHRSRGRGSGRTSISSPGPIPLRLPSFNSLDRSQHNNTDRLTDQRERGDVDDPFWQDGGRHDPVAESEADSDDNREDEQDEQVEAV